MRIEIDYNGSFAVCKISDANDPDKMVNFNDADQMSQIYALSAFDCVKRHWERERKGENIALEEKRVSTADKATEVAKWKDERFNRALNYLKMQLYPYSKEIGSYTAFNIMERARQIYLSDSDRVEQEIRK